MRRIGTEGWAGLLCVCWLIAAPVSAQAVTVTQLDLAGGSIDLVLQVGTAPPVRVGGDFTQSGRLVMGQYQPQPNIFAPITVGGHTFSLFTHPGLNPASPLPVPTGEVAGNTIAVNLHALFAGISGSLLNGALNIGTQAPILATGSYDPSTGAFEIAWAHAYSPPIQFLSLVDFTLAGTASVVPLPPAIILFGSGVIAILAPGLGLRRRARGGPVCGEAAGPAPSAAADSPTYESGYILLISRDAALIQEIESWFRRYRYEVDCATDLSEAATVARRHTPSAVLVDRRQRGWEMLRGEPALLWVPMMTLLPTGTIDPHDALTDLERGMDGYHLCEEGYRLLVARVRALIKRAALSACEQAVCRVGDITLDSERFEVTVAGRVVRLPLIQFRILHLLMQSPERVYRSREIVDHVWGRGYSIGRHTLPVHMFRIRKLLGVGAGPEGPLVTIRNVGYKFGRPPVVTPMPPVKSSPVVQRSRLRRKRGLCRPALMRSA